MGPALLLLPLMPLLTPLLDALPINCQRTPFGVQQPEHLEAPEGGSIRIHCSFYHSWELAKNPDVSITWRWKSFHGEPIYNQTLNYTHKKFKNRLLLDWTEGQKQGALLIQNLQLEDTTMYFCRVQLTTKNCQIQVFQSINGTKLTITPATKTTQGPTSTAATTRADTSVNKEDESSGSMPLSPGVVAGVAVAGAVLIIAILGLIFYICWKRSKGLKAKNTNPARESLQNTGSSSKIHDTMENKGHHTDAKLDPTNDSITYASLTLSKLTSPAEPSQHHPHNDPQEEILYCTLKT